MYGVLQDLRVALDTEVSADVDARSTDADARFAGVDARFADRVRSRLVETGGAPTAAR